ncbi:MAG: bifunctional 23S rRNA (guanine(2069)-N(7))-methyltransferase RlmK/23S rRNA (guanine(2445)-N(2))-methyltransferase RlmL [Porticoccaceae bacterium]
MASQEIFVNCPKGMEALLREELLALGASAVRETVAGVYASGDAAYPYRVCLWSRIANRVLLPLARVEVNSAEELYQGAGQIDWSAHMDSATTFAVDFAGRSDAIRHSQFGAQKIKDAVVDQFVARCGERPGVDLKSPDLRINAYLAKGRVALSLDLSGDSLHRRGYRVAMVPAPLKENLAAALLLRAGWPQICARGGALIDPMCGSGTLLIEGAMMAADIAPGIARSRWGFRRWRQFDAELWRDLVDEAQARAAVGRKREIPEIRGYDKDARAVAAAQENIVAAGLEHLVRVSAKPLQAVKKPTHKALEPGLLITNPPYGERWGEVEELRPLYRELGNVARTEFAGWRLGVFTGNLDLAQELRLRADRNYALYNGTIAAKLFLYSLREEGAERAEQRERPLSDNARMLVNRLQKNARRLKPWLTRSGVSCYRLYDSDLPEYAVAIDLYGDAIHVQEYAPPASVDANKARQRLRDVRQALSHLYPQSRDKLHFKERRRQSGDAQYQPQNPWNRKAQGFVVTEGAAKFEINLDDYLDSGLFLDHRPVRAMIGDMARGKRFLNLFCYTAAATVQAALGGARESLSLDMSNTYLEWAKRNFELNGLDLRRHALLRADCLEWLAKGEGQFDLIFLDPPTFSNSKKMVNVLDIQRDHVRLVEDAMALLAAGGTLIFSNNFRRFRMDETLAKRYDMEDITPRTIPPDFERNPKIHHCWLIRHRGDRQDR